MWRWLGDAGDRGGQVEEGGNRESGWYKWESEPIDQTPPTDNLKVNAPPRATFSKTNSTWIKEPIYAIESSLAASTIGSSARIINLPAVKDSVLQLWRLLM